VIKNFKKYLLNAAHKLIRKILQIPIYIYEVVKATFIGGMIMLVLGAATQWAMARMGVDVTLPAGGYNPYAYKTPLIIIQMMIGVGIFEEVIFRYFLMDYIMQKWLNWAPKSAIIGSALLFGCAHMSNLGYPYSMPQVVGAAGLGIWLGHLYIKKGLHMCIITHFLYNSCILLLPPLFN